MSRTKKRTLIHAGNKLKPRTAWHPLFFLALRNSAHPDDYEVLSEVQLSREPQRADYVIIKCRKMVTHPITRFRTLFSHVREYGLAELKGPGDGADGGDFCALMSHAWQFTGLEGIGDPSSLCLFVVANELTKSFRERCEAYGGQFRKEDKGIWLVRGLSHVLYFVETGEVHELEGEELMYMFSDGFVSRPGEIKLRNEEQLGLFIYLCQQVEQLKGSVEAMGLKDLEKLDRAQEEALLELVVRLPREKVLSRYTFGERLQGLPAEEVLERFAPEERLRGLPAEERLRGLPATEVLERFAPEEVLEALSPEQLERFKKLLH